jgi:hypothetical protein
MSIQEGYFSHPYSIAVRVVLASGQHGHPGSAGIGGRKAVVRASNRNLVLLAIIVQSINEQNGEFHLLPLIRGHSGFLSG